MYYYYFNNIIANFLQLKQFLRSPKVFTGLIESFIVIICKKKYK